MKTLWLVAALVWAPGAPVSAQVQDLDAVEITLQEHGGRLFVPVRARDGTEFEFVLSTGSGQTLLTESTAAQLGEDQTLFMGGVDVDREHIATVPDERLTVDGRAFHGMIGSNTLNAYDVLVDLPRGRIVLKAVGPRVDWAGVALSAPVRLQVYHGVVFALEVELGGEAYRATLDLGTPTLVVNRPVQNTLALNDDDVGVLTVGDQTFSDLPVRVLDLEVLERWDPSGAGFVLIGAPIAYACAISLSWIHQEMRTCVR